MAPSLLLMRFLADHFLGRPDTSKRKYQLLIVLTLWTAFIYKKPHGPRFVRILSQYIARYFTPWQVIVISYLIEYVRRNFAHLVGLESPEPLADMYNRDYFRATWVTTALDAGFWTAMNLRPKWIRDLASVVFSTYYLVCAERADQLVRKVRGKMSLEHLRVSWNKPRTPYLKALTDLMRPLRYRMRQRPRRCRIPRPDHSPYKEPIMGWMYFNGTFQELATRDEVVLDIPGGGFVAMDPRCHDDKLMAWATTSGLPVLALDYGKAPEHPYPWALDECYDAYYMIVRSKGRCIGLKPAEPKIVLTGDSAGGNLAAGLALRIANTHVPDLPGAFSTGRPLPMPVAILLIYPALDMNMTVWLSDEQVALMRDPARRKTNRGVLRRNTEDYCRLTNTPHGSDDEREGDESDMPSTSSKKTAANGATRRPDAKRAASSKTPMITESKKPTPSAIAISGNGTVKGHSSAPNAATESQIRPTRLQLSSMIAYFNDRILSPEMLRGMIMLYIPPDAHPDFDNDHYLSPLRAPESLLARFPKVYLMCGERDPLVDDSVLLAGRLRQAHLNVFKDRKELGMVAEKERFDDRKHVETMLIPGVSHGFLQFVSVFPQGWKYIEQCSHWLTQAVKDANKRASRRDGATSVSSPSRPAAQQSTNNSAGELNHDYFSAASHRRRQSEASTDLAGAESSDNDDAPLEMSSLAFTSLSANGSERPRRGSAGAHGRQDRSGRGRIRKPSSGQLSPVTRRKPSLIRLASTEDLMRRRMLSLTGGLRGEGLRTP